MLNLSLILGVSMNRFVALLFLACTTLPLSGEETKIPSGFSPLFNGKDLKGWKVSGGDMKLWGVEDGKLFIANDGGGWLLTDKQYGDFEFHVEFKVPQNGNSGVALRTPFEGDPAYVGMEIQILDDDGPAYKKLQPYQYTGSIYGVVPPKIHANKPAGEWNVMHITAKGPMVKVEVNGKVLVDANLDDYKKKHKKAHPGLLRDKGHLGLQSHGGKVEFKNIWVKELN